jgi:hypothetical protein
VAVAWSRSSAKYFTSDDGCIRKGIAMKWEEVDVTRYHRGKQAGWSAERTVKEAIDEGVGDLNAIRLVREMYGLDLSAAKELMIRAKTGRTLDAHQAALLPAIGYGEYRLYRQAAGKGAFAEVAVTLSREAHAGPEVDPAWAHAAARGADAAMVRLRSDLKLSADTIAAVVEVRSNLVDTTEDAVEAAAAMAVGNAVGERFELIHEERWHVVWRGHRII